MFPITSQIYMFLFMCYFCLIIFLFFLISCIFSKYVYVFWLQLYVSVACFVHIYLLYVLTIFQTRLSMLCIRYTTLALLFRVFKSICVKKINNVNNVTKLGNKTTRCNKTLFTCMLQTIDTSLLGSTH